MTNTEPVEAIETERLMLVPLPFEVYGVLLGGDQEEAEKRLGLKLDGSRLADLAPIVQYRFDQLQRDPSEAAWLIRLMVLKPERTVVGDIGFHAPPNDDGMVEIGYTVIERFRRQGFAYEAASGLSAWAVSQPGVRVLRASVSPTNRPSLNLVAKLGLAEVGRQMDEIDGEEIVFEAPLPLVS